MGDITDTPPHEMPGEAIVVTGLSGIFPRSESVQEFMENLYNQVDMIDDEPRWTVNNPEIPRHAGKVKGMEKFDAQFFKVGYQQAMVLEPMSRKLLEHAYGAIFDSGNTPTTLKGKTIGVFIGASYADFSASCMYDVNKYSEFMVGGSSKSMLANRISYWVDGRGPSFCLDYSCASSTAALEQAFKSMRAGGCDAAVVGGCNLITLSSLSLNLKRSGLLCHDGKTKCFDKNGDGFVRSDAVSLIFLQKAKDAKRIYAELCHIEGTYQLKHDDQFLPTRKSDDLEKFIKNIYLQSDIDPKEIEYVEANGAALVEADENEVSAIAKVFGDNKTVKLGSVKSNMGHSEPASGLCALTKLCLAYHKGQIPANLHCHEPIQPVLDGTVQLVTENTAFGRGYSALNNFSLTGANFHVILKGHYKKKNLEEYTSEIPRIVAISGRQESCVGRVLDDLKSKQVDAEEIALLHSIFANDIAGHTGRGYVVLDSIAGSTKVVSEKVDYYQGVRPPLWFVFSGMGSQWTRMGADLMRIPSFAKAVKRCDKVLAPKGIDIVKVLTEPDDTLFESVINAFVGIAAVQIGFTDILKELGIEPDYIIGHSLGEMACAYHDETFTAEEMILGTYNRAKAIQETSLEPGSMAAVGLGYKALVSQCPPEIDIACHNSAESCTISGPVDVMKQFVDQLTKRGVFARAVQSANIAYHSRYVAGAGPNLLQRLKNVLKNPKARSPRWISTSVPREHWDEPAAKYSSAEYHTNNVLNPVLFEEAISLIPSNAVVVEIAPHGLMQAVLKRSHKECTHIPLARRGEQDGVNFLLDAIGKLYNAGFNPRVEALYPAVAFPVATETPLLSHLVQWEHSEDWPMLLDSNNITKKPISRDVVFSLHDDDYKYLEGHVRNGVIALPDAALLMFVWETLAMYKGTDFRHQSVVFTDIQFVREIIVPAEASVKVTVMISKGNESFEVTQNDNLIVSGKVRDVKFLKFHQATQKLFDDIDETNTGVNLLTEDIYKILRMRGFDYKGKFQSIFSSNLNSNKALIKWNEHWVPFLDALIQLNTISKDFNGVLKPKFIRRLKISVLEQENAKYQRKNGIKCFDAKINNDCGVTRCAGIEIEDITYSETPLEKNTTTMLESKEFFPFYPTDRVDIQKATEMNLQIISENSKSKKINITKFVNEQNSKKLDYVDEVADKVFLVNEKTCCVKSMEQDEISKASVHSTNGTSVYVLQNLLQSSKEITNLYNLISEDVFILSTEDRIPRLQSHLKDRFTILSCMSDGTKTMILMKKRSKETTTYISINFEETSSWVTEVYDNLQTEHKQIVVISERQKYCGILGLVQNLKANGHNNISAVVIDDDSAPKFDHIQDIYTKQMQKNLTFNILKEGQWGSYYFKSSNEFVKQASFALKDESEGDVMKLSWIEIPKISENRTCVQVCYSGLSNSDLDRKSGCNKQFSSIGLDFSGINTNGVKVMGLITGGSVATSIKADPHLTWPVPEHWTLEDAATVPAAYLQAYYCLRIRSQIEKGKSVLILDGPSDIGLALISLCAFYECNIFTVLQSAYQKDALLMLHPHLSENNVIISEKDGFYHDILAKTKGLGCDFVINFKAGCIREAATRCVGFFGHFLDFSKSDMFENKSIGMAFLVQSHSYVAVDFRNILRPEFAGDRKRLQNYITQGIISGAVKPLSRVLYSPLQIEQALTLLSHHKYIGKVLVHLKHESVANGLDTVPRLAPRIHCMWPPKSTNFNRCINGSIVPDNGWDLFRIRRVFYTTDNLAKARAKAKQAEFDSEVNSDGDETGKRKTKKKLLYDSSDNQSDEESAVSLQYPKPPGTTIKTHAKTSQRPEGRGEQQSLSRSTSESRASTPSTRLKSSIDESHSIRGPDHVVFAANTEYVIAKHLARIESDIKELHISQHEILQRLRSSSGPVSGMQLSLPEGITLPCDDHEALIKIETWIDENGKHLVTYLGLVGGNKLAVIIRKILEKLITNRLALEYNWTGKNNKLPLKDMKLMKIIRDSERDALTLFFLRRACLRKRCTYFVFLTEGLPKKEYDISTFASRQASTRRANRRMDNLTWLHVKFSHEGPTKERISMLVLRPRVKYAPQDVVIVVCDGNGFGVEVADQLVERGARNLHLLLKTGPSGYQLAKFVAWRKRKVSWKLSADDVQTEAGAKALLENAKSSGKVKGLFVVLDPKAGSGKEDFVHAFKTQASVVINLDVASRKEIECHFVILSPYPVSAGDASALSLAERVCDARHRIGLPSLVLRHHSLAKLNNDITKINSIQPQTLGAVFSAIETSLKLKHHSALSLELMKEEKFKKEVTSRGMFTFYQHVDAEEDHVTSQEVVELPTLYHSETEADWNSIDPYIILIPGFEGRPQIFESMAERLKLRAISVKLGPDMEGESIHEIAFHVRKQLKSRFGELKSEKFYVLGYSFGANVALELAAILEREGHVGVVHCVDGSPDTMKTILDVVFENMCKENLQNVVLNHMHNLISKSDENLESDLKILHNKDEHTMTMNKDVNCSIQYKKCVLESACKRIAMVWEYSTTIKLKSVVVLMKSSIHLDPEIADYDYGLSKYTGQPVKVFNLTADHATALHDNRVSNIVNMFADTNLITNNKQRHEA